MLNTKELKRQVQNLIKSDNQELSIHVNEIVGIDENDELVYIENIRLARNYSLEDNDNLSLTVSGMTFRKITVQDVEERTSEDWAYEERDLWVSCVQSERTDDSLLDWWNDACEEAKSEGLLYPFDDDSDRSLIEAKYKVLPKKFKDKITEEWGTKGSLDEDLDEEVNQSSDWLTVYCGSMGSILEGYRCYANSPYKNSTEVLKDWKVCLYPELMKFLAKTIDEGKEEKV